jgi:hypothetical protein
MLNSTEQLKIRKETIAKIETIENQIENRVGELKDAPVNVESDTGSFYYRFASDELKFDEISDLEKELKNLVKELELVEGELINNNLLSEDEIAKTEKYF